MLLGHCPTPLLFNSASSLAHPQTGREEDKRFAIDRLAHGVVGTLLSSELETATWGGPRSVALRSVQGSKHCAAHPQLDKFCCPPAMPGT